MTLADLTAEIRAFCEARGWTDVHTPKALATGIATEAGELLHEFRFLDLAAQEARLDDPDQREAIEDELADVLFFALRFADKNDIDLEAAVRRKLAKNDARYPVEEYNSEGAGSDR